MTRTTSLRSLHSPMPTTKCTTNETTLIKKTKGPINTNNVTLSGRKGEYTTTKEKGNEQRQQNKRSLLVTNTDRLTNENWDKFSEASDYSRIHECDALIRHKRYPTRQIWRRWLCC